MCSRYLFSIQLKILEGFHDDWQLVVELIYELDGKYAAQNAQDVIVETF